MKTKCTLEFEYENEDECRAVAKAVEIDNEGFVGMKVVANKIISTVEADNLSSLLHTIDDFLVCISTAEKVLKSDSR